MTKVHGKRYAYKFDFHGLMAACQAQAQGPEAGTMMAYSKYHHHPHAHLTHPSPYHPYHHPHHPHHSHLHGSPTYSTVAVTELNPSSSPTGAEPTASNPAAATTPSATTTSKSLPGSSSSPTPSSAASPLSPILYNYWPYSPQAPPTSAFDPRPPPAF